jgi:ketosteroid isomerase-like protein
VTESPIDQLLGAVDRLDVEAAMALMTPGCRLLAVDSQYAEGAGAVRELLTDFVAKLRVTAQWHQDDVWIAEVEATYELRNLLKMKLRRAFVLRDGPDGFVDLRVYGAHERPFPDHDTGEQGMRLGGRWIPPL